MKRKAMKQFIVHQTIEIAMCYLIEAETLLEAQEMDNEAYDRSKIIDIQVLDWDHPWMHEEAVEPYPKPVLEDTLKYWSNIL